MAVEFLTDEQAARYGSFHEAPSRAELERYFFLDDADREAVKAKRRSHNRLGYAVQLTSVRFSGRFMPDPRQVPVEVAEYLAGQLEIEDASCLKLYGERNGTARTHAGEIQEAGAGGTSLRSASGTGGGCWVRTPASCWSSWPCGTAGGDHCAAPRRWRGVVRRAVRAGAEGERVFALAHACGTRSFASRREPATRCCSRLGAGCPNNPSRVELGLRCRCPAREDKGRARRGVVCSREAASP